MILLINKILVVVTCACIPKASASQSSNVGVGGVFFNSCFFPFKPQSIIFYNRLYLSWESSAFCASLNDAIQTFFSEWQKVKSPPVDITLFKMLFVVVWCSNIFLFIFELFAENVQSIMASVWLLVKFFSFYWRNIYFAFSLSKKIL